MEDYIMTVMKRASVFMILAQALIHFRPNPSYEKYFKFLAGMMTMVILIIPAVELARSGIGEQYKECIADYTERMEEASRQDLALDMAPSDYYLNQMEEEIKTKLNNYLLLEGYAVSDVKIVGISADGMNGADDDYKIELYLAPEETAIAAIRIEKIGWEDGGQGSDTEKASRSDAEEAARREAARLLEIGEDRLEVKIDE